jgi:thiol-disulfide isomerase/thioredoxin
MAAWRAAAAALALLASAGADDAPPLRGWSGGETPALAGLDLEGRPLDLRALRGRVVLVQFWASWCEPCQVELPALARLRASLRGRPFEVVTVNLGEGPARARQFVREHAVDLPVLLDGDRQAAAAWGVGGLPMAFLVDAQGRIEAWVFGECRWDQGQPGAALERLLDAVERTRPAGPPPSRPRGRP